MPAAVVGRLSLSQGGNALFFYNSSTVLIPRRINSRSVYPVSDENSIISFFSSLETLMYNLSVFGLSVFGLPVRGDNLTPHFLYAH